MLVADKVRACEPTSSSNRCSSLFTCLQACQECLQTVLDLFLWSSAELPVANLSATFESICKQQNAGNHEENAICSAIASKMLADPSTNMGRRAGVICSTFKACGPMGGNMSCTLTVKTPEQTVLKGDFSMCTIEGIDSGRLPPSSFLPPGKVSASRLGLCFLPDHVDTSQRHGMRTWFVYSAMVYGFVGPLSTRHLIFWSQCIFETSRVT